MSQHWNNAILRRGRENELGGRIGQMQWNWSKKNENFWKKKNTALQTLYFESSEASKK